MDRYGTESRVSTPSRILGALLLAGIVLPAAAAPVALADADLLYCAEAYAEGASLLKGDSDSRLRRTAGDAALRARALAERSGTLLREAPDRHDRASRQARERLAALPAVPVEARRLALRAALLECRFLEAGNGRPGAPAAVAATPPAAPAQAAVPVPLPTPTVVAPVRVPLPTPTLTTPVPVPRPAPTVTATFPATTSPAVPAPAAAAGASSPAAATPVSGSTPASLAATASSPASPGLARAPAEPATAAPAAAKGSRKGKAATPAPAPGTGPKAAPGLGDADLLYCTQVYGEVASTFGNDKGEAADAAREARARWLPLSTREHDLLNDHPERHSRALAAARPRLSVLPEPPGRARNMALRSAYEECLGLEQRADGRPAPGGDRLQMLAKRRFCRDLLMSKLKVSAKVRAGFSPSELASLQEIQKIGEALAQPMPGAALTAEQDLEANREARQLRDALEWAAAGWRDGPDPVAQAIGRCHDDYVQGRLGDPPAPPATAEASDAAPAGALATPDDGHVPVVRPADLGPVFHMREVTPAGNIDGIWVRRGASNLYDGLWVQANGQMQRDVLELRGIVDGQLTLYRQGYRGTYQARVRADGRLEPGTASWFRDPGYTWAPLPTQPVRGANLGAVVHMREVTPLGNYDGIWRQRGQTGVYDVLWVFLPTGEVTADVLAVTGAARGRLIIQRQDGPGLYPLRRRAEAAAKGGRPLAQWEVLPAQAVRLGKAAR